MKYYSILVNNDTKKPDFKDIVAIYKGFNIWACLFHFWWALYKRQFMLATLIFSGLTLLTILQNVLGISNFVFYLIIAFTSIIIGIESDDWVEKVFLAKQYKFKEIIMAGNIEEAKYKYLNKVL